MSDKEFRVRNGLVVGNNVLVANVTSNTVSVAGSINAASIQVNGTTIPSGATSNLVFDTVNTAFSVANAAFGSANNVAPQVEPAFNTANAAYSHSNTTYAAVNSAFAVINAAFTSANNVAPQVSPAFNTANAAFTVANAAFGVANTALQNTSGLFNGSLAFPVNANLSLGSATTGRVILTAPTGDGTVKVSGDGTNYAALAFISGAYGYTGTTSNLPFHIFQNGGARLTANVGGNIGIGTTTPAFKTEIVCGYNNGLQVKDDTGTVYGGYFTESSTMALVTRSNHGLRLGTNDTTRMSIDSSGRITMPYQPKGSISWTGTLTRGNIIPFATVNQEAVYLWNTSTYRLTAPVAGYYIFTCVARTAGIGGLDFNIQLLHNGSSVVESWAYDNSGGKAYGASFSHIRALAANDYVQFYFNHDSASPAALNAAWASYALLG